MSHRYKHVRNLRQLDDEMLKLKLRKEIIAHEFSDQVRNARRSLLSGKNLIESLLSLFSFSAAEDAAAKEKDRLDQAADYIHIAGQLLDIINGLRRR